MKLPSDPLDGFLSWLGEAQNAQILEPTAMSLATVASDGRPAVRVVLYKGMSQSADGQRGLNFFTNYTSHKSHEMTVNSHVAATFFWAALERQIRFEGRIEKLTYEESNAYFQTRPRGSQIGAWSSPQSQVIADRETLQRLVSETEKRFSGQAIPCPPHWGGWRIVPDRVEFWQGQASRLHDRSVFTKQNTAQGISWATTRLAP